MLLPIGASDVRCRWFDVIIGESQYLSVSEHLKARTYWKIRNVLIHINNTLLSYLKVLRHDKATLLLIVRTKEDYCR